MEKKNFNGETPPKKTQNEPVEGINNNELAALDSVVGDATTQVQLSNGCLVVTPFKDYVAEGHKLPPVKELIPFVLVEHETTILFGDTGLGKTTLSMQFAIELAQKSETVLFVNCELSQAQFSSKYNENYAIPQNLFIANIDYEKIDIDTNQEQILSDIEQCIKDKNCSVVVIDNLSFLCNNNKDGKEATSLMQRLLSLRNTNDCTMMVLAHAPKRKKSEPLTINDLAGSKALSNFADNVVGINSSKKGPDMRYLIQLKYRSFPLELNEKNVQDLKLTNEGGVLHFDTLGFDLERKHLPHQLEAKDELTEDILRALETGRSCRDIAAEYGVSKSTVNRIANKHKLEKKE